jgi:hypothetical protein
MEACCEWKDEVIQASVSVDKSIMGPSTQQFFFFFFLFLLGWLVGYCCLAQTHNHFVNYIHTTGSNTTVTTMRDSLGNHNS